MSMSSFKNSDRKLLFIGETGKIASYSWINSWVFLNNIVLYFLMKLYIYLVKVKLYNDSL